MKDERAPQNGDMRYGTQFLILPRRINGKVKWMTRVKVIQFYHAFIVNGMFLDTYKFGGWHNIKFV